VQSAAEEAVEADQLARPLRLHVLLDRRRTRRLVRRRVAGDEREPLRARVEPVPAQAAPDAVAGDDEPAPTGARELGRDPPRAEPRVAEREGDDPLLDQRRELIGHPWSAALARPQRAQALALDPSLPGVVGRTVDTERAAGRGDADPSRQVDQLQPVAEQDIILGHATRSFRLASKRA